MTLFMELTAPRRRRIEMAFDVSVLPQVREFLGAFACGSGWDCAMAHRLDAVAEETLLTLLRQDEGEGERARGWRLLLTAHKEDGGAVLEFIAGGGEENLQDRIALDVDLMVRAVHPAGVVDGVGVDSSPRHRELHPGQLSEAEIAAREPGRVHQRAPSGSRSPPSARTWSRCRCVPSSASPARTTASSSTPSSGTSTRVIGISYPIISRYIP